MLIDSTGAVPLSLFLITTLINFWARLDRQLALLLVTLWFSRRDRIQPPSASAGHVPLRDKA